MSHQTAYWLLLTNKRRCII